MVKVLHAADLHLDTAFSATGSVTPARRRSELRATFIRMVELMRAERVDVALLAGDLYEDELAMKETGALLAQELAGVPDTRVFIAPGNHDFAHPSSLYATTEFPPNVTVFGGEGERVELPELGCDVYGRGFTRRYCESDPLRGLPAAGGERVALGVFHGDVGAADSPYGPIDRASIAASGLDYLALGHVHKRTPVEKAGGTAYAYAGCLEGRSFDETGVKGVYLGTVDRGDARMTFVPLGRRRDEIERVDIEACASLADVRRAVAAAAEPYGGDCALRVVLTGANRGVELSEEFLAGEVTRPFYCEVRDETRPAEALGELLADRSLRGEFARRLAPRLEQEGDGAAVAAEALRIGLAALDGQTVKRGRDEGDGARA